MSTGSVRVPLDKLKNSMLFLSLSSMIFGKARPRLVKPYPALVVICPVVVSSEINSVCHERRVGTCLIGDLGVIPTARLMTYG